MSDQTRPVEETLAALRRRETRAGTLLEGCLERVGDDARAYTTVFTETARAQAAACDCLLDAGLPAGTLAGLPVSVKALFDVAGAVTHAGSRVLADAAPATADATAVARLRAAGAVLTGHTNMTEFAYSGLGLNPHYETPANPADPARIPGGSSSGGAVSVARGMAAAALGSDTGGSVRIPAAFCGLTGFKPSQHRVPLTGALPLSHSLDSVGPIAPRVADCALLDAVLAGETETAFTPEAVAGLRLAVPDRYLTADMDATVTAAFERAVAALEGAGARVTTVAMPELDELGELLAGGGFTAAESYWFHRDLLAEAGDAYDPRVSSRIRRGADISAADYLDLLTARRRQVARMDARIAAFDAVLAPTVPVVPPRFDALEDDDAYARTNLLVLRNPTVGNLLDLCGISLPCHTADELPVGLMLLGRNGDDRRLLARAAGVEAVLDDVRR
ncbi:2-amino-5-chloromuconic acid deaminase [wastewater metagenome]|uniref:2-amino-5-chloromuconic acid deaminase n=2 Tax=unclassified sequences TaxID=12908 RepID=A0A5B8RDC2_9ZZZZ|nr:2-amino-5-chloromuconic acid deaminase [uncultured organism]